MASWCGACCPVARQQGLTALHALQFPNPVTANHEPVHQLGRAPRRICLAMLRNARFHFDGRGWNEALGSTSIPALLCTSEAALQKEGSAMTAMRYPLIVHSFVLTSRG